MGNATSIYNLLRNLGGSIGVAFSATMFARRAQVHQSRMVEHLTTLDEGLRAAVAKGRGAAAVPRRARGDGREHDAWEDLRSGRAPGDDDGIQRRVLHPVGDDGVRPAAPVPAPPAGAPDGPGSGPMTDAEGTCR